MNILIVAAIGAAIQEIVYWYGKRHEVLAGKMDGQMKEWMTYLIIVLLMIIASSVGTYVWFEDRVDSVPLRDAMLFGAGFPAIFKVAVKSYASSESATKLGKKDVIATAIKSYFV